MDYEMTRFNFLYFNSYERKNKILYIFYSVEYVNEFYEVNNEVKYI